MKKKFLKFFLCLVALLCTTTESFAFGLPTLTTDVNNPVLYRIKNTRRSLKTGANYLTSAGALSATQNDGMQVYFVGTVTDDVVKAKMYDKATGKALSNIGNSKPSSGDTENFTWSEDGVDIYLKAKVSAQTSTYHGLLISIDGRFTDNLTGDASGGDVWYVGSSDPVVWAYSGQYDGAIFDLEPVAGYLPELTTDKSAPVYYRLYNMYTGKYAVYTGTSSYMSLTAVNDAASASLFYFMPGTGELDAETYPGAINVDIFTSESGDYQLRSANSWELHSADSRLWYLQPKTNDGYAGFFFTYTTCSNTDCLKVGSSDTEIKYYGSGGQSYKGSIWQVEKVEISADAAITSITWRVKDGETILQEETRSGAVEGEKYTTKIAVPGVNLIGETTVTAGKKDQVIDLTYTVDKNAPFQYSTDFASAKWYSMTIRNTKSPCYDAESNVVKNGKIPAQPRKGHLFAFVGNPWSLKILNAELGEGYALGAAVENETRLAKMELAEATQYRFEKNGNTLAFAPISNTTAHLNDINGELAYWTASASGTDGGSNFSFEPVDEDHVKNLFAGTVVWKYTSTVADVTTFDLSKASNYDKEAGKFTDNGGWTFDTPKDLTNHMWLVVTTTFNASQASRPITLTDANGKSYSGDTKNKDGQALTVGPRGKMWLDRWNNQICAAINLNTLLKDGFALDQVSSLTFSSGSPVSAVYLTNYEDGQAVKNTEGWGSCTGDYVREYAHLGEGEYAFGTVCLPYAAAVSGAKVYSVTGCENNVLALTQVNGVLTAGVPYIFKADDTVGKDGSGASNVNFFRVDANEVSAPVFTGKLVGTFTETVAPVGSYVLQNQNDKYGFYKVGVTVPTIPANRAYYAESEEAEEAKAYYFNTDATAIETIEVLTSGKAKIYDLNGRQLNSLQKGINIVNGKKILVK